MPIAILQIRRGLRLGALIPLLAACGGGGGSGGPAPAAAPAVIDLANAASITREVIAQGIGAGSFGVAIGGGSILSADGGAGALTLGARRSTIQQLQPAVAIPAHTFDCLQDGTVRLSGSIADPDTLTSGDRINATFTHCDDADGVVLDGGMRIDVTAFSGDLFSDLYLLGARLVLTDLAISADGSTDTGSGTLDFELDLRVPLVSDLVLSGPRLDLGSGGGSWVLRDFAVSIHADDSGTDPLTQYAGTGTLEGSGFEGAVDFVTVSPLLATGADYPATGEVLITGAGGATIRATVLDAQTLQLAIDLDGDSLVDDTRQIPWNSVGNLGLVRGASSPAIR